MSGIQNGFCIGMVEIKMADDRVARLWKKLIGIIALTNPVRWRVMCAGCKTRDLLDS